jgi:hypothetical protein
MGSCPSPNFLLAKTVGCWIWWRFPENGQEM